MNSMIRVKSFKIEKRGGRKEEGEEREGRKKREEGERERERRGGNIS